jgi:hypothetical protein
MTIKKADVIRIVERWENPSFLCLVVGKMTAQKTRTALAVVRGIKAELKQLLSDR